MSQPNSMIFARGYRLQFWTDLQTEQFHIENMTFIIVEAFTMEAFITNSDYRMTY